MENIKFKNLKCFSGLYKRQTKLGFTLVEMLIAVALFTVIAAFSLGAILSIFDASRKSQSTKTVVDNLNFTIENMARTIRFGSNYHCGNSGTLSVPSNCADSINGDNSIAVTFGGNVIVYGLCGTEIHRSITLNGLFDCSSSSMPAITAGDVVIQSLKFYVFGTTISDTNQPYVLTVIKGYVGNKPTTQSTFSIQTLMSQRGLDL